MVNGSSGLVVETNERLLTASEFQNLANVPPEVEWFANIENANTRRAYLNDVREFTLVRFAFNAIASRHQSPPSRKALETCRAFAPDRIVSSGYHSN